MKVSIKRRLQKVAACTGAMAALAVVPLALLAEPASAAWPATLKICNATDSSDTNGATADGYKIDVDRLASSSWGTYSNELDRGECTGAVNDPANIRIDYTDDGANTGLDSVQKGVDEDGIDDSQGPWDGGCLDTNAITNENAWPIPQTLAEHVISPNGIDVRIRDATVCGATLADHIRVCNESTSTHTFDLFKLDGTDADTALDYNNELLVGECSNWKDADGSNPLKIDVSDDGANVASGAKVEWNYDLIDGTSEREVCNRVSSASAVDQLSEIDIPMFPPPPGTQGVNVRLYNDGTAANTLCGTAVTTAAAAPQTNLPTCTAPQPSTEPAGGVAAECETWVDPTDPGE